MSKIELDYDQAHEFVLNQRKIGSKVRWDGWDIVIWKHNPNGFTDKHGAFRDGRWGVQIAVAPDSRGIWKVPKRYVKHSR